MSRTGAGSRSRATLPRALVLAAVAVLVRTATASAQAFTLDLRERAERFFAAEPAGPKFGHAWLARVRGLQAARGAAELQAPQLPPGMYNLRGVFRLLVIPGTYSDVNPSYLPAQYDSAFFALSGKSGWSTLRQYYSEVSGNQFTFVGTVLPWIRLDKTWSYYIDSFSNGGRGRFEEYIRDLLVRADSVVDWRLYDNDGPDGIPNSGDDDGYVDMVAFLHPLADGVCRRDALGGPIATGFRLEYLAGFNAQPFTTRLAGVNGQPLKVDDFILSAGLHCNGTDIATMNINVHEMGHALGLPDLNDLDRSSYGVGVWDVMGYGLYAAEGKPAYLGAWSRRQLGWNSVFTVTRDNSVQLDPAEIAPTTVRVDVPGTHEYFLLENREQLIGDVGLPGGGLLIWHVDNDVLLPAVQQYRGTEDENHPGLAVVQADGRRDLALKVNVGDAGDPFPGSTGNTAFAVNTIPPAVSYTGAFAGFAVDSIRALGANGPVAFRLRLFGALAISSGVARPSGVMGAAYTDTVKATGGTGMYTWVITGGALPAGVTFSSSGVLSGFPRESGNFSYTARVTSASQQQSQTFSFSVSEPTLITANVVAQLLGSGTPLTADQTRYLDFLGNNNGGFDLGDFLAWVKRTGAPLSVDVMRRVASQTKGGRP